MDLDERPGYNAAVDDFRTIEYPMLKDSVYLDHAGTTLYPKSLIDRFAREMTTSLLGNPHSVSPSSQQSTLRIENTRLRALQLFNANPSEFDLVFVANTTAGIKLVAEALRAAPQGFDYVYHQSSHTSLVGVREEAQRSFCLDDDQIDEWISGGDFVQHNSQPSSSTLLFAYPGQSNMDGRRYPVNWSQRLRSLSRRDGRRKYTLLDAAALAATCQLDLGASETAPDFTVVSFAKMFGFPDLGALIVRRQAESAFDFRKYFGGGTVDTIVCHKEQWHALKTNRLHERLEDGTLPLHSIVALDVAIRTHRELFGPMCDVTSHVAFLGKRLYHGLKGLRHGNNVTVCEMYSPEPDAVSEVSNAGSIIAFNLRNQAGAWVSLAEVEKLAGLKNFHIRTGGVCNPGGIASALNLQPWEIKRNFSAGFRCGSENDIIAGKPTGVIRASLGAMSTISDVDAFIAFINEFYCESAPTPMIPPELIPNHVHNIYVSQITVYPIKSCGGFAVPTHTRWQVRPEGLAWDREWCLLHQGTEQALSQKRYPDMSLIRPSLDFKTGQLRVTFTGKMLNPEQPKEISVPLSSNPALFRPIPPYPSRPSRVCGEEIFAQTYVSEKINSFFSAALGVPCMLARFPAGGPEGSKSTRHSKAHLQKHQKTYYSNSSNGVGCSLINDSLVTESSVTPPSPPDSDAEEKERRRILLSNESPILAINMASLRALNKEIIERGGTQVFAAVFRANIVLDSRDENMDLAYAEDNWSSIRIGQLDFKMLGSCRRCHMVCINQETGEKGEEPFVTLSKTRRFDGKVFFGTHMCLFQRQDSKVTTLSTRETQNPTVEIGDLVVVE
ncbi:hypothetical protein N0V93_001348 [Gnomoniopsis smithogilvyi]|uniref:Molybdenum cofactor sulfurase n=1 Tax=Gnomoniopsis smithogilvyi TaxID=1191159 RepID=A0A9W8Z5C9_9PEZI|nr:hypothetical protein N0V93_001348 [Gnomoniopsis smithogilvyi]